MRDDGIFPRGISNGTVPLNMKQGKVAGPACVTLFGRIPFFFTIPPFVAFFFSSSVFCGDS